MLVAVLVIVAALHNDFWLWTNKTLVFGFLPIGLAYHMGYALLASFTMYLLVKLAWPVHLEAEEDGPRAAHTADGTSTQSEARA
jgi:hypothetical protein